MFLNNLSRYQRGGLDFHNELAALITVLAQLFNRSIQASVVMLHGK